MIICDLCKNKLNKTKKHVYTDDSHICKECIDICVKIVNDPTTDKLVYLNQYKDILEIEKEKCK